MKRYVVYDVWTSNRIIEAENDKQAYDLAYPYVIPEKTLLNLCNWYIVEVPETREIP